MIRVPQRLILASAGTGKTWQLTGRFLELLLAGVEPERILATTFTRKAAGEILDRLLARLVQALESEDARAALSTQVGRALTVGELRALLARLTRKLDRFRVVTLDAFFVHLARLFALELGLPADWRIVEEAEDTALRREALAHALVGADRAVLVEILRGLQKADSPRSVERILLSKVKEARDAFLESERAAWLRIVVPAPLSEARVAEARAALEGLPVPLTKARAENKLWRKALDELLAVTERGDWDRFVALGIVERVQAGVTDYARETIPPAWSAAIKELLPAAAHELVGQVARENVAARDWLEIFEASYEELKQEERAYRFEDLPKALHPREESRLAERETIWFRLDGRVDHVLFDEFQDTAPVQWRILARLVEEILADGTGERSFFCVGDVKQSIYGWREAEPRLLAEMPRRFPGLVPEKLVENHRSSPIVLDTVDRVFGSIAENEALAEHPERQQAARTWRETFDRPEAARKLLGAVWLVQPGEPGERATFELAAERARAIRDEAPRATIGVLLRRNEHVARMIYLLRQQGVRASGEGGNPLTDSAAVLHALSLLHLADHPGDSAAAFHVATSPLAGSVGFTLEAFREQREEVAAIVRKRVAAEGHGAFCASFLDAVSVSYGEWDRRRFEQLVDLAYAFEARAGARLDAFVDHVRATRVEDPSALQVKVMTIHTAKGLEFDAVLLPELDLEFTLRETELMTHRPDPAGLQESVSHSRSQAVCALEDRLHALWTHQKERETREALCLLYVAMTRAKHRLDLIVQRKEKPSISHTFAGVLRHALGQAAGATLWAHPENDAPWFPPELAASRTASAAPAPETAVFRAGSSERSLVRRTPSAAEGEALLSPQDLLRSSASEARLRGSLVHHWLSEVEWLDAFARTDEELLASGARITREAALLERTLGEFRGFLNRANTCRELTRPAREVEVWRERSFSVLLDDERGRPELWSGAFDRVALEKEGGRPVRATVIDFKTDAIDESELEQRAAFYRPQLEGYRRVLAAMTGLPESAIGARLLFLHVDRAHEL